MKSTKIKTFFLVLSFLIFNSGLAIGAGTTAGILLRQDMFGRSAGLGETFTAVYGDIASLYYNPAGLYGLTNHGVSFSYSSKLIDTTLGFLGYHHTFKGNTIAVGLNYLDTGKVNFNFSDGSSFSRCALQEGMINIGYARKIQKNILVGITLKGFYSNLVEEYKTTTEVIDVGCIYLTPLSNFAIGISAQNIGSKIKYGYQDEQLPQQLRVGMAYKFTFMRDRSFDQPGDSQTTINIAADSTKDIKGYVQNSLGIEFTSFGGQSLRVGYKFGTSIEGLTIGLGLYCGKGITFDYAFGQRTELENIHHTSIKIAW